MIFLSLSFTCILLTVYFAIRVNRIEAEFNELKQKLKKEGYKRAKEGTST